MSIVSSTFGKQVQAHHGRATGVVLVAVREIISLNGLSLALSDSLIIRNPVSTLSGLCRCRSGAPTRGRSQPRRAWRSAPISGRMACAFKSQCVCMSDVGKDREGRKREQRTCCWQQSPSTWLHRQGLAECP